MARVERVRLRRRKQAAIADDRPADNGLDQFYTLGWVAAYLYQTFLEHFDPKYFLMVEPSAGTGAFFVLLPIGSRGYDKDPKCAGVEQEDFLAITVPSDRPIAMIGNPPFGKNASMAIKFFNHAASQSKVVAMILPRSFRKASIQNRLHRDFHLVRDVDVPEFAFLFEGKPKNVPCVFQIWVRRLSPRALHRIETKHPDFEFTTPDKADFAIQRIGARAGRVHHDFGASPSSHYFIKGPVEKIMAKLDFASVVRNVAGNPSLSKCETVSLYRAAQEHNSLPIARI